MLTKFITFFENRLLFKITFTKLAQKNTIGGVSKETPEVFSYPITTVQQAVPLKQ
ncbi:hypothetical protein [Patiriisocius sp. Uisw_017]|jgi:hypothetical protein|uniref:hypothetical protein n=1 Tax=Patiriisocius sp. Uisw_017 TaxID=3230968 RepID=UPI0039EB45FE